MAAGALPRSSGIVLAKQGYYFKIIPGVSNLLHLGQTPVWPIRENQSEFLPSVVTTPIRQPPVPVNPRTRELGRKLGKMPIPPECQGVEVLVEKCQNNLQLSVINDNNNPLMFT